MLWKYPEDGSTLTIDIDIDHVRVIDEIRLRFDFQTHEWVAAMERQGEDNLSAPTGEWIEVARWSRNAPKKQTDDAADSDDNWEPVPIDALKARIKDIA